MCCRLAGSVLPYYSKTCFSTELCETRKEGLRRPVMQFKKSAINMYDFDRAPQQTCIFWPHSPIPLFSLSAGHLYWNMQSGQIKAAPPGGLKMEIDRVFSRETQTLSTAVLLQWCYDLCNWMIKVANLFGTFFPAVAQLCIGLLTRHWCAALRRSITDMCIFRRNVSLGTFCWHRRLSICTMVQCPPSQFSSLWFTTSHSNVHQLWNLCLFCTWNEQRSYVPT